MADVTYSNATSNTGTCTVTAPAGPGVVWNLTSLSISQAGPTLGPNAKLAIYDGAIGTTPIFVAYLGGPESHSGVGSVGMIQEIPLPETAKGTKGIQASPGNAMNVQVTGTGANQVSINARFMDGLP